MSGRHARRSKGGCGTCRRRKVKCGEERPICKRCFSLSLTCEWLPTTSRHKAKGRSNKSPTTVRHLQPALPQVAPSGEANDQTAREPLEVFSHLLATDYAKTQLNPRHPNAAWFSSNSLARYSRLNQQLSDPDVPCANSLSLSELDRAYFKYFPSSSVVFYYMKNWQWSSFNYLYQGPAATNKTTMRMILAMSASDMHRNGLVVRQPGKPSAEDHARYHYGIAMKEFRQLLESPRRQLGPEELETVFVIMFLMITYEWQLGHSVHHLQLHLQGVRSLLETYPNLLSNKDVGSLLLSTDAEQTANANKQLSLIPEQLLLWILYVDISCRPMGLTDSLVDYVLRSQNPALHPDRLYRSARLWGRCYWGSGYPDNEVTDDLENYRALELLHEGMMLRYKQWKLFLGDLIPSELEVQSLFAEVMDIRDKFFDLFVTAKITPASSTRRTVNTIYMAVSTFYSQVIFHWRVLCPGKEPPALQHQQAVQNTIEIMHKQYESDPRLLRRLHWPLLAAVIETTDAVEQQWLRDRLSEFRAFHTECHWAHEVAEEVLTATGEGRFENLRRALSAHAQGKPHGRTPC